MRKLIIVLVCIAALVAAGWWIQRSRVSGDGLVLYGNVDIRGVDLGFRVGGRLLEVVVDEGDAVKKGELLARIDPAPYEHELARAAAELAAADAELRLKRAGFRREEIDQARATVAEARVAEEDAQRVRDRHAALRDGGGTSQQNLDSAEAALAEVKQRVLAAEARLRLLESGFRPEEIAAAEAKVALAQAAHATAALRLADTELKSPSEGVVLTRALEPGSVMQPGETVISLSLEDPVWVRAYVEEPDLGQVPPGTQVLLSTDGQPERVFHGRVGFVSSRAEFTPRSVETPELRTSLVYRLRVVVEDSDGSLRQGMPVTLSLASAPS